MLRFSQRPELAPAEVEASRQERCDGCPHNDGNQCRLCTCFIPLKIKFSTEFCPDTPRHWDEYFTPDKNGLT